MLSKMGRALILWGLALALACGPRAEPAARPFAPAPARPLERQLTAAQPASGLWAPRTVTGYDPHQSIRLVAIPAQTWDGDDEGSAHFRDVMEHTSPAHRWTSDDASPSTIGHETLHGLLAERELRGETDADFYYFERGFGAYVPPPQQGLRLLRHEKDGTPVYTTDAHTSLEQVRAFLPEGAKKLAAGRYETYLLDEERVSYAVSYLFDEWNAYITGARIAVETHAAGYYAPLAADTVNPDGSRSRVTHIGVLDGMVDFLYFCSAGLLALADNEPGYLENNEQLRAVYAEFAEETMHWLSVGSDIDLFRGTHAAAVLAHFRTSPENQRIRDFLTNWLGAEWTRRVLGW